MRPPDWPFWLVLALAIAFCFGAFTTRAETTFPAGTVWGDTVEGCLDRMSEIAAPSQKADHASRADWINRHPKASAKYQILAKGCFK